MGAAGADGAPTLVVRVSAIRLTAPARRPVRIPFASSYAAAARLTLMRNGYPVVELRMSATAGANAFIWNGWIGPHRARPGTYTYELTATDALGRADAMRGTLQLTR